MLFTLGFQPLDPTTVGNEYDWAIKTHEHLMGIFLPFPIFFIASMLAYLTSQFFDVWFFELLSKLNWQHKIKLSEGIKTVCQEYCQ